MEKVSRKRVAFTWHPVWTIEIERWTGKQVKDNLWRFDKAEDTQDIMQDARLLFFTLSKKYPIVNETAHFFSLYKTSLSRMFIDKARLRQKSAIDQDVCADEVATEMQLQSNMPNVGHLNLLIEELPDELKIVLRALTTGRIRLKLDKPAKKLRYRENYNMRLKRLFSLATTDPVGDLRNYFANL